MRNRWWSKRSLLLHLAVIIWVPGCILAGWWQVTVALSGNALSYLYSVEWPVFAIFGAVVWWHAIHDDPSSVGARALARARAKMTEEAQKGQGVTRRLREQEDERLAAYNDYLAELSKTRSPKTWRHL